MSEEEEDQKAFEKLIPELKLWNDGKGVDLENWIYIRGRYDLAVGYSLIFWPPFVEFEGYVLRKRFNMKSLRGFETQQKDDRKAIESIMNNIDLVDIHMGETEPSEEQILYLGNTLLNIHRVKLAAEFPDRKFEVVFDRHPGPYGDDHQLSFWQVD